MIKTTAMMLEELKDYASPKTKLSRMIREGQCIQVVRGLYETDPKIPPFVLAGSIYGPSYISFEYALSRYGMIPEKVYAVTCASFDKKKKKKYETPFGTFTYRDVPAEVFPYQVILNNEGNYWYRIASPEKALCDQLYTMRPAKNRKELSEMLFEDLRVDTHIFQKLDPDVIEELGKKYHTTNIKILCNLLRRS